MNEHEWLTSGDPEAMLNALQNNSLVATDGKATKTQSLGDRKLRLFAVACCREIWHLLMDERSRRAVEVAEAYADGLVSNQELSVTRATARAAAWAAMGDATESAVGEAAWAAARESARAVVRESARAAVREDVWIAIGEAAWAAARSTQAAILREIVGNPFRSAKANEYAIRPWCRDWHAVQLAQAIYDDRHFDRIPILADALEDAGCCNADILEHCRNTTSPHVRGCWVLDLILGKT